MAKKIMAALLVIGIVFSISLVTTSCGTSDLKTDEELYVEHKARIGDVPSEMRETLKEKVSPIMETDEFFIQVSSVMGLIEAIDVIRLKDGVKEKFSVHIESEESKVVQNNIAYSLYIGESAETINGYWTLLNNLKAADVQIKDNTIVINMN